MSLIQLNETQQEIQAMARAYAQRELVPLAGERDQESRFDRVMVTQMAELGFFGMLTPERFDGLDLDAQSYLLALEEIADEPGVNPRLPSENLVCVRTGLSHCLQDLLHFGRRA